MRRTNTFDVRPLSDADERLLHDVLDASAALWNETNYERRQVFFGRHDEHDDVFAINDKAIYARYAGVLGAAVTRSVIRKNDQAWRSFFSLKEDPETRHKARPPGYWGNEEDGRELRTYVRNDSYTLRWGDRSRLEIPVGSDLKNEYDHTGRLRLEVRGDPRWQGKQGQLELQYDETTTTYRAFQPVTVPDGSSRLDTPLASEEAALVWAQTTSSPVRRALAGSSCTKAGTCSLGSARRRTKLRRIKDNSPRDGTAATGYARCTEVGHGGATTP